MYMYVSVARSNITCYMYSAVCDIACLSAAVNYTLKNAHGLVGKVSLFKPSYKLGEDVVGLLDLGGATIACLQVSNYMYSEYYPLSMTHKGILRNIRCLCILSLICLHVLYTELPR